MIEYVNLLLLLIMFGSTCYVYYKLKKIFYLISIVMDSEILDQLTNLGRDVNSEFPKPKRGRKKKADTKMNELEDNDVRNKRKRLVACVLSGNSNIYLGKEYTEQQINEMDCTNVNILLNRYESVLSAQMTKSLGKSIINLYSNIACSVLGVGNQQELSTDLECDPFLKGQLQRFYKLISNDRIWPSEHGFEVIFEKSLFVFEISAFKIRNKHGIHSRFHSFSENINRETFVCDITSDQSSMISTERSDFRDCKASGNYYV